MKSLLVLLMIVGATGFAFGASNNVELNAYAEWRHNDILIVDGQRVVQTAATRFKGDAKSISAIPLGYEVKVKGERSADGIILAREIESKKNGNAMFETDLVSAFDEMEKAYRVQGHMFESTGEGKVADMGELKESGPEADRVRRITAKLVPPYLKPEDFRVYVVDNKEWNAMAAPNRSIYVYSGLLKDMDDDEVAIVLGHELVHATHEHSRKQYKSAMWVQLATAGAVGAEGTVKDETKRVLLELGTSLASSAWMNGYSREHEDQADHVGLRYAYEGGFDITKGPKLWARFAEKYGGSDKVTNFFFGDHSVAKDRERNLERELQLNYPDVVAAHKHS